MAVSPLPGHPNAVWTVKKNTADDFDSYIVVSFVNATLVRRSTHVYVLSFLECQDVP
jgi:hypothetical protein